MMEMDIPDDIDINSIDSILYSIVQLHVKQVISDYAAQSGNSGLYIITPERSGEMFDRLNRTYNNADERDKETVKLFLQYIDLFR